MNDDRRNRTIRVAHLLNPIKLYGKEKWLLAFLKHIDRERIHSIVILIERDPSLQLAEALAAEGIQSFLVRVPGRFSWKGVLEIAAILERESIDILHSHDSKADVFAFAVKCKTGARIVSTPHGWSNERDVKLQFYQLLDKQALRFFDRVSPLSSRITQCLPFRNPKKVVLIRNFIDLSTLPPPGAFDEKLVSFMGRLTPLKRVEDAIEALRFVDDREIRLQVIGDGYRRPSLERLADRFGLRERVSFLGFRADALDLLNRSATLVVPSLTEGISRVAMEAMALGKPVIGTDIPGNRELIRHGETGIIVPVRRPAAIAAAMRELLGDQARYQSISRAAKDYIEANHSAARAVKRYEELYEEMMSVGARPDPARS